MRQMFVQKVQCEGGDGEEGVGDVGGNGEEGTGVRVVMMRRLWDVRWEGTALFNNSANKMIGVCF